MTVSSQVIDIHDLTSMGNGESLYPDKRNEIFADEDDDGNAQDLLLRHDSNGQLHDKYFFTSLPLKSIAEGGRNTRCDILIAEDDEDSIGGDEFQGLCQKYKAELGASFTDFKPLASMSFTTTAERTLSHNLDLTDDDDDRNQKRESLALFLNESEAITRNEECIEKKKTINCFPICCNACFFLAFWVFFAVERIGIHGIASRFRNESPGAGNSLQPNNSSITSVNILAVDTDINTSDNDSFSDSELSQQQQKSETDKVQDTHKNDIYAFWKANPQGGLVTDPDTIALLLEPWDNKGQYISSNEAVDTSSITGLQEERPDDGESSGGGEG